MSMLREPGPAPSRVAAPAARRGRPPPATRSCARPPRRHDPAALAERFGTPFYAYDLDVVTRQVDGPSRRPAVRRSTSPTRSRPTRTSPCCGTSPALGAGCGRGVRRGAAPRRCGPASRAGAIVFTGPGKRDDELAGAVEAGVRVVTVESPGELRRLARIAEGLGRRQPILLRAAVSEAARLERVRLVGDDGAGKFGMDGGDLRIAAGRGGRLAVAGAAGPPRFRGVERAGRGRPRRPRRDDGGSGPRSGGRRRVRAPARRCRRRPRDPVRARGGRLDLAGLGRRLAAVASRLAADADHARRPCAPRAGPLPGRGRPVPMSRA